MNKLELLYLFVYALWFLAFFWILTNSKPRKKFLNDIFSLKNIVINLSVSSVLILQYLFFQKPTTVTTLFASLGIALLLIGIGISIWSKVELGSNWGGAFLERDKSIQKNFTTSGLYKYTRNPMYMGFILIWIGGAVMLQSVLFLIFSVLLIIFLNKAAAKEEKDLEKQFGKKFIVYKHKTPRFIIV